jgi:hypothetical protein
VLADFAEALRKRARRLRLRLLRAAPHPVVDEKADRAGASSAPQREADVNPNSAADPFIEFRRLVALAATPLHQRSVLDRARRLHDEGLHIIPLEAGTKEPSIRWREWQASQMPLSVLANHVDEFGAEAGLAIICGAASGIVVADLDDASAVAWAHANLPETPWRTRTSRGEHWFYRYPTQALPPDPPPWAGQLQSNGRYVVAPGSLHPDGHVYECLGDWSQPKEQLPIFDPKWLIDNATRREMRLRILKE